MFRSFAADNRRVLTVEDKGRHVEDHDDTFL